MFVQPSPEVVCIEFLFYSYVDIDQSHGTILSLLYFH